MERPLYPDVICKVEFIHDSWNFAAMWHERRVGYAWCTASGEQLEIGDLKVEDDFIIPTNPVVPQFLPAKRDFRRKGIGSALLRLVIKAASDRGMKQVYGTVSVSDSEGFPQLTEWLQEFGLKRSPPDRDTRFPAAWKFTLDLTNR